MTHDQVLAAAGTALFLAVLIGVPVWEALQ